MSRADSHIHGGSGKSYTRYSSIGERGYVEFIYLSIIYPSIASERKQGGMNIKEEEAGLCNKVSIRSGKM